MTSPPFSRWLLVVFLLLSWSPSTNAQPSALVGPTAINPADSTVIENATVVIDGPTVQMLSPSITTVAFSMTVSRRD